MVIMMAFGWIAIGYLLGSCPTGYLLVRLLTGIDIRTLGSCNIGATNVGRVLGKKWAIATAVFDMSKGGIAVLLATLAGVDSPLVLALTGGAAVIGHNYPVWLQFKGGKGVATTFGVLACFDFFNPWPALIGGIGWFLIMKSSRYVSLASMLSLFLASALMPFFNMPRPYYLTGGLLALLCVWRHRANIQRLLSGTESKV